MPKENEPYQNERRKRAFRFSEEQETLRRSLRDIKTLLITLVWVGVVTGALVAGTFVRLLFWGG